jgi:2-(1,2-epoxy-1,2-dihydrophenyl)acetyl-CoA isomerase
MLGEYVNLKYELEDNICTIILNRPDHRNSLTLELVNEINEILSECSEDSSIKVIIITGSGDSFCSGVDLKMMHESNDVSYILEKISKSFFQVMFKIRNLKVPVITAINGHAIGGGLGLILASDIRVAVRDAKIATGFIKIGGSPAAGTTYFLPRMIGLARATELLFLGESLSAEKAAELGIINRIYASNAVLMQETHDIAIQLCQGPTAALSKTKMLINQSADNSLIPQLEAESMNLILSGKTEDFIEGLNAFVEKRKPQFKGK